MAGVGIDDFGASFIDYLPGVTETLNNTVLLRRLARNDHKWEGKNISFFVHTARNHGLGNVSDGGALPVADKQDYVEAKAFRKFLVGSVQITDGALANAATSKRAARDVVTSELRGMMESMAKYENFMGYRDGTGTVAALAGTTSGGDTTVGVSDARLLWDGQTYEVRDAADITTLHGTTTVTRTVRALDAEGNPSYVGTALPAGVAVTDFLVWPGAVNRAITGLDKLIDDASTTFQNISTTTYPRYTSPVLDNSGTARPLSPTLFRQMLAMIRQESGQDMSKQVKVLTNHWQAIEMEELYESELRITPDTKTVGLSAATFASSFGQITVVPDHDAPFNKMFFVDFSEIYRAVQKELDWRRNKGGGIFNKSDASTVYLANAIEICEYFIKQRNRCGKIEDLSETAKTAY
jgi:hypothetical protein